MKHLIYGRFEDQTAILYQRRLELLFAESMHIPNRVELSRNHKLSFNRLFINENRETVGILLIFTDDKVVAISAINCFELSAD